MDFGNERYVRLYVRDTVTWKRLGWDGQNALTQMLRKADRSGVIDLGGVEPWESLVVLCGAPEDSARRGMARCLELECIVHDGDRLVFPRYLDAQECAQSDAQRQRESRAKRGAISRHPPTPVTNRDHSESQNVTESHGWSQDVTSGHSVPCRTVPSVQEERDSSPENNSNPSAAAAASYAREDFGGGRALREVPRDQATAAERGAAWLSKATSQEAYSVHGKWAPALAELAAKPEKERAVAAAVLAREAAKADVTGKLTPRHVNDYWHMYREGKAPGQYAPRGSPPTAAPEAPLTEAGKLLEKVRALERAERACLYDEGAKKARIRKEITDVFAQMKALEGSDVRRA